MSRSGSLPGPALPSSSSLRCTELEDELKELRCNTPKISDSCSTPEEISWAMDNQQQLVGNLRELLHESFEEKEELECTVRGLECTVSDLRAEAAMQQGFTPASDVGDGEFADLLNLASKPGGSSPRGSLETGPVQSEDAANLDARDARKEERATQRKDEMITGLEALVAGLERQLIDAARENAALQTQLQHATNEPASRDEESETLREDYAALCAEMQRLLVAQATTIVTSEVQQRAIDRGLSAAASDASAVAVGMRRERRRLEGVVLELTVEIKALQEQVLDYSTAQHSIEETHMQAQTRLEQQLNHVIQESLVLSDTEAASTDAHIERISREQEAVTCRALRAATSARTLLQELELLRQEEFSQLEREKSRLESAVAECEDRHFFLQTELGQRHEECEGLKEARIVAEAAHTQQQALKLNGKIEALQIELGELCEDYGTMNKQMCQAEAASAEAHWVLEQSVEEMRRTNATLNQKCEGLQAEMEALCEEHGALENAEKEKQAELTHELKGSDVLLRTISTLQMELEELRLNHADTTEEKDSLVAAHAHLSDLVDEMPLLTSSLTEIKNDLDETMRMKVDLEGACKDLESDLAHARAEHACKQEASEQELCELKAEHQGILDGWKPLIQEVEKLRKEHTALSSETSQSKAAHVEELSILELELQELRRVKAELELRCTALDVDMQNAMKAAKVGLDNTCKQLQSEINTQRDRDIAVAAAAHTREISALRTRIGELQRVELELQEQVRALTSDLQQLTEQHGAQAPEQRTEVTAELEAKCNQLEQALTQLQGEHLEMGKEKQEAWQSHATVHANELSKLEQLVVGLKERNAALEGECEECTISEQKGQKGVTHAKDRTGQQQRLTRLKQQHTTLETQHKQLQEEQLLMIGEKATLEAAHKQEVLGLVDELTELMKHKCKADEQCNQLNSDVDKMLQLNSQATVDKSEALRTGAVAHVTQVQELEHALQATVELLEIAQNRCGAVEAELRTVKQENCELLQRRKADDRCTQLDLEINELLQQNSELSDEVNEAKSALLHKQLELADAIDRHAAVVEMYTGVMEELDVASRREQQMQTALEIERQSVVKMSAEAAESKVALSEAMEEAVEKQRQVDVVEAELASFKKSVSGKKDQARIAELEAALSHMQRENNTQQAVHAEHLTKLQQEHAATKKQLESACADEAFNHRFNMNEALQQESRLEEQLRALTLKLQALHQDKQNLRLELKVLQEAKGADANEKSEIEGDLAIDDAERLALEEQLVDFRARYTQVEAQNKMLQLELQQVQQKHASLCPDKNAPSNELVELEEQFDAMWGERAELHEECRLVQAQLQKLVEEHAALSAENKQLEEAHLKKRAEMKDEVLVLSRWQDQMCVELKEELHKSRQDGIACQMDHDAQLREFHAQLNAPLSHMDEKCKRLQSELIMLQQEQLHLVKYKAAAEAEKLELLQELEKMHFELLSLTEQKNNLEVEASQAPAPVASAAADSKFVNNVTTVNRNGQVAEAEIFDLQNQLLSLQSCKDTLHAEYSELLEEKSRSDSDHVHELQALHELQAQLQEEMAGLQREKVELHAKAKRSDLIIAIALTNEMTDTDTENVQARTELESNLDCLKKEKAAWQLELQQLHTETAASNAAADKCMQEYARLELQLLALSNANQQLDEQCKALVQLHGEQQALAEQRGCDELALVQHHMTVLEEDQDRHLRCQEDALLEKLRLDGQVAALQLELQTEIQLEQQLEEAMVGKDKLEQRCLALQNEGVVLKGELEHQSNKASAVVKQLTEQTRQLKVHAARVISMETEIHSAHETIKQHDDTILEFVREQHLREQQLRDQYSRMNEGGNEVGHTETKQSGELASTQQTPTDEPSEVAEKLKHLRTEMRNANEHDKGELAKRRLQISEILASPSRNHVVELSRDQDTTCADGSINELHQPPSCMDGLVAPGMESEISERGATVADFDSLAKQRRQEFYQRFNAREQRQPTGLALELQDLHQ